jgi:uncharacterized protein YfbU (UPF0304 family)
MLVLNRSLLNREYTLMNVLKASNRNAYQEFSWEVNGGRRVRLRILLPSLRRLSR